MKKQNIFDKEIKINEIFFSIQGEGSYSGYPCTFIRTTGCNLRCFWCDTKYSFYEGSMKSIAEIVNDIQKWTKKKSAYRNYWRRTLNTKKYLLFIKYTSKKTIILFY